MSLEFTEIDIKDKERITSLLKQSDFQSCEYSFANNLAWRMLASSKICFYKDFYFLRSFDNGLPRYTYPAGSGDIEELMQLLKEDANKFSSPLMLITVLKPCVEKLVSIYGDKVTAAADKDSFDYIYDAQKLITLSGKKYHGKRNHIANFKKSQWEYRTLEKELFDDCIAFSAEEFNAVNAYTSHSAVAEQFAIDIFFKYFDELGLKGGVLFQNGRLVGFTIGERLNSDTFVVHIEKALHEVQGAYPTLFNEFLKAQAGDARFINREDDVGLEGLRKSKLSYHPEYMLEKFSVTLNI